MRRSRPARRAAAGSRAAGRARDQRMPWRSPLYIDFRLACGSKVPNLLMFVVSALARPGERRNHEQKKEKYHCIILENWTVESMMRACESYIWHGILWYACRE